MLTRERKTYRNGAVAERQPNGMFKIISGPTHGTKKRKQKKQKGGFVGEVLQGVTEVVQNIVKNLNKPKTRREMTQYYADLKNDPHYIADKLADDADTRNAGYRWEKLQSGRYQLFHPITGAEITNAQGEPVIMKESEFIKYKPTLNALGQDSNLPVAEGQGLFKRQKPKTKRIGI